MCPRPLATDLQPIDLNCDGERVGKDLPSIVAHSIGRPYRGRQPTNLDCAHAGQGGHCCRDIFSDNGQCRATRKRRYKADGDSTTSRADSTLSFFDI